MEKSREKFPKIFLALGLMLVLLSASIMVLALRKPSFAQDEDEVLSPVQPKIQNKTVDLRGVPQLTITKPQPLPVNPAIPTSPISSALGTQRGCIQKSIGINGEGRAAIAILLGAPAWVSVDPSDRPVVAQGVVRESKITHTDYPLLHDSHDQTFHVRLDPKYNGLNSDANSVSRLGERLMEMEWESKYFPFRYWPSAGDRVWMEGRWIFDCGHPPYRTEIHPPQAVAFTRFNPIIFPGDSVPSDAVQTSVYIHGRGGYYNAPVGGKNYEFDVILPPKPSPNAQVRMIHLFNFGGPAPVLTPIPASNPTKIHVVYPLASVAPSYDRQFAAIFAAGWDEPRNTQAYRQLQVTVDSVRVLNDQDPIASGEYRLWTNVNGNWIILPGTGLNDVDNGETVRVNTIFPPVIVKERGGALFIQSSGWESDLADNYFGCKTLRSCPTAPAALDNNDKICGGNVVHVLADNFGIGRHITPIVRDPRTGGATTCGDFVLNYNIVELKRFPASPIQTAPGVPIQPVP